MQELKVTRAVNWNFHKIPIDKLYKQLQCDFKTGLMPD